MSQEQSGEIHCEMLFQEGLLCINQTERGRILPRAGQPGMERNRVTGWGEGAVDVAVVGP